MVMRSFILFSSDDDIHPGEPLSAWRPRGWLTNLLTDTASYLWNGRRGGSLFDELGCFLGMRDVGHMAGIHFNRLGIGALRHHALLVRIDRPICGGHNVPAGLGLPGRRRDLVGERVSGDRHLRLG